MEKIRCAWVKLGHTLYERYHDIEWGKAVHDERVLFEFLILEGAQAGLSWITVLQRRETYKKAFGNFDPKIVANFTHQDIERLMQDTGIIRNRKKIESSILNAKIFLDIQKEFGSFDTYIWGFTQGKVLKSHFDSISQIPTRTPLSDTISKDLQKRGMKFVGSTIIYAFLQAVGIVDDHTVNCFCYKK